MSKFSLAMDALTIGENGSLEYTAKGVGDNLVALFIALVRNIPLPRLQDLFNSCMADVNNSSWPLAVRTEALVDLIVLIFQTRNCRGGKGEKKVFYYMLLQLYSFYPETTIMLLPLIAQYGYYKDYLCLLEIMISDEFKAFPRTKEIQLLKECVVRFLVTQLKADHAILSSAVNGENSTVSLCAKYMPRENSHFANKSNKVIYNMIVTELYGHDPTPYHKASYRKLLSSLTSFLEVPEQKMCSHHFSEIDFTKIPSICTLKCRKAFLNELITGKRAVTKGKRNFREFTAMNEELGNRYPTDPDRVEARKRFKAAISTNKVKGGQLFPHTIVDTIMKSGYGLSESENSLMNAQWAHIRENVITKVNNVSKETPKNAVRLDRFVPLVDVSGSMSGDPMLVAIALGILVSEITHPSFRNRIITFETDPKWVTIGAEDSITEKVRTVAAAPWGGSTDIDKAFRLIKNVVVANKIPPDEIPDLIIFSDMQFNTACGGRKETQLARINQLFTDAGMEICGKPYPTPQIVFWNLRGDTKGFPATATSENVQMLSGFSPSLLELVMSADEVIIPDKPKVTPYDTFRKAVDHENYDLVREILSRSEEEILTHYHYGKAL